jgi:hypothetical protein
LNCLLFVSVCAGYVMLSSCNIGGCCIACTWCTPFVLYLGILSTPCTRKSLNKICLQFKKKTMALCLKLTLKDPKWFWYQKPKHDFVL